MKKSKLLRNVSLVALSAIMVGGTAMAFTGCAGSNPDELRVFIFCNNTDLATNQSIVDAAMAKFNQEHSEELGREVRAVVQNQADRVEYFQELQNSLGNRGAIDVFYVPPKNVASFVQQKYILDLTPYLTGELPGMSDGATENANMIWPDALALYGMYTDTENKRYVNADSAKYDAATQSWKNGDGNELGIYGLPKDYSSFSMGYNRNFFTDEMKKLYTTVKATAGRSVTSHSWDGGSSVAGVTHTGGTSVNDAIQYAVTGSYTNPYTDDTVQAVANTAAPIINVGVPTRYKPFNFYNYATFSGALAGGDPIALSVAAYSEDVTGDGIGDGYIVTIPGFPNDDPMDFSESTYFEGFDASSVPYDATTGYITYTYAEYGALQWALAYFLNTFAWDNGQKNLTDGQGGVYNEGTKTYWNIYGGEQYDTNVNDYFGVNGYLLPWLASNDTLLTTTDSTRAWNTTDADENSGKYTQAIDKYVGTDTETVVKKALNGGDRSVEVQYGFDSRNFIETYGAFHEIATTWNGNAGNAGDTTGADDDRGGNTGWTYFTMGASIFYGAGTWDASTRNNSDTDDFWFGQMPVPVSEKLALYSYVRNGYYGNTTYSNDPQEKVANNAQSDASSVTGDYKQRNGITLNNTSTSQDHQTAGLQVYFADEIAANQLKRQDKWAARMDSVGYAVNSKVTEYSDNEAWKEEAAVYVVEYLTIDRDSQVTLTYGGAQMPNFMDQCEDFLNYKDATYNESLGRENAFAGMITPDDSTWGEYYKLAREMETASRNGSTQTVAQFLTGKTVNGAAAKYNSDYANTVLSTFTGTQESRLAYAMRVLNMVNFDRQDRDLNMRMEYGINSVRDQLMYTSQTNWLQPFTRISGAGTDSKLMAYIQQKAITKLVGKETVPVTSGNDLKALIALNPAPADYDKATYITPAVNAIRCVAEVQKELNGIMRVSVTVDTGNYEG